MKNTLYTGDNLHFLFRLNSESVDLIYLDPPFNSKRLYSAPVGSKAAGSSFNDMWSWKDIDEQLLETLYKDYPFLMQFINSIEGLHGKSMKSYCLYMAQRLIEMHRILKENGTLYLHCDPTASHYLKLILDRIFGKNNYRNELVWHYRRWTNASRDFSKMHDVILRYGKTDKFTFNKQYQPFSDKTIHRKMSVDGKTDLSKSRDVDKGVLLNDVWQIPYLHSQSKERTGFPTQKPLALMNLIIKSSSNEGDVVMDPFCGCATTCVAAQQLNRKWIGIDIADKSVEILMNRLKDDGGMFTDFIHTDILPARTDIEIVEHTKASIKEELYKEQGGTCNGCGNDYLQKDVEVDHIIPKSKGGSDTRENYQLLCGSCNTIKGNRPMEYLLARIEQFNKTRAQKVSYTR